MHNHTGTACLLPRSGLQLDINEDRQASKTLAAYSLAGTRSRPAGGQLAAQCCHRPRRGHRRNSDFQRFPANATQIATATTDCSGNFWVKATDDTRNMPQYYNGGSRASLTRNHFDQHRRCLFLYADRRRNAPSTPAVTTTGGGCTTQPTGTALMNGTSVAAVVVANSGKGCTSAPTSVNFTPTCSVTPTATATLSGRQNYRGRSFDGRYLHC
ncbi:MAG: hypothetical protein U1F27_03410 [Turneriella sp.]